MCTYSKTLETDDGQGSTQIAIRHTPEWLECEGEIYTIGSIKSRFNEQNENRIFRSDILKESLAISIIEIIQKKNRQRRKMNGWQIKFSKWGKGDQKHWQGSAQNTVDCTN